MEAGHQAVTFQSLIDGITSQDALPIGESWTVAVPWAVHEFP